MFQMCSNLEYHNTSFSYVTNLNHFSIILMMQLRRIVTFAHGSGTITFARHLLTDYLNHFSINYYCTDDTQSIILPPFYMRLLYHIPRHVMIGKMTITFGEGRSIILANMLQKMFGLNDGNDAAGTMESH